MSDNAMKRDLLLRLVCGGRHHEVGEQSNCLGESDWDWIAERAQQYRLFPLLHAWFEDHEIETAPAALQEQCKAAVRLESFQALQKQQALLQISELFGRSEIQYAALKGVPLALQYYSAAALRPMRDIDVLVSPKQALSAYELLKQHGFTKLPSKMEHGLEQGHHLPLLLSPDGVGIEIHHTVGPRSWAGAVILAKRLLANAYETEWQGCKVWLVDPTDNLLHLTAHASLQHLFDNGPIVLADLHALFASGDIDWLVLEREARALGLAPALSLLLKLLERYGSFAGEDIETLYRVPDLAIEQAANLMVQEPALVWHRDYLRRHIDQSITGRLLTGLRRALHPKPVDMARTANAEIHGLARWWYYPHWLVQKAERFLVTSRDPALQSQAKLDCALQEWLDPSRPGLNLLGRSTLELRKRRRRVRA